MSRSLKNGVNTHRIIETSPIPQLLDFISSADGSFPLPARDLECEQLGDTEYFDSMRALLTKIVNQLDPESGIALDKEAQRVLTLAEDRGEETINLVSDELNDADLKIFDAQPDSLGRSLWLYRHHNDLFEDAENLYFANHYRNCGKMYDAFEVDAQSLGAFSWDDVDQDLLEKHIQNALLLPGRCFVSHLLVQNNDREIQHMLVIRHGGRLSSVPGIC